MNYTVLIVDDEIHSLNTLQKLINWSKNGFEIISTATNGKDALKKYVEFRPDLVITDIQMPIMDGLDLIRQIKNINLDQKIIIISCHENFYYAKQAIKLNVKDYIIKDLLTNEELTLLLQEIKLEFDNAQAAEFSLGSNVSMDDNIKRFNNARYFFEQLLSNNIPVEFIDREIKNTNLRISLKYNFVILNILIDNYDLYISKMTPEQIKRHSDNIMGLINNSMDEYFSGEVFFTHSGEFLAIACIKSSVSKQLIMTDCTEICHHIRASFFDLASLSITIGISNIFKSILKLNDYIEQSKSAAAQKIFFGKGKNIFFNSQISKIASFDAEKVDKIVLKIKEELSKKVNLPLDSLIGELYNVSVNGIMQYNYVKEINSKLFGIIIEEAIKNNLSYIYLFDCNYIPFDFVDSMDTVQDMSQWFLEKLQKIQIHNDDKNGLNARIYSKKVCGALNYIDKNYASSIGLEEISDFLKIHKGYLCRIFKQETGQNITEYIINKRIDQAKLLIETKSLKLYEVSEKVGFNSPQQFSFYFKRITGKNPGNW